MDNRTQFTFYDSFFKAISRIRKAADRAAAYDAICAYALYGTEPDIEKLPDSAAIAFEVAKPNLDASRRKAISGKEGGSKRKQTGSKPEANASKPEAIKQEKDKEQDKDKDKEQMLPPISPSQGEKADKPPRAARFTPPSLEEVKAYCQERGNKVDPDRFLDFYASKGWMVGKNRMKDWRAAVRNWERGGKENGQVKRDSETVEYGTVF